MTTDYGLDDIGFSFIGDIYRKAGVFCNIGSCVDGFFDPRKTWGGIGENRSPVWNVARGVYFMDYIGYLGTGH